MECCETCGKPTSAADHTDGECPLDNPPDWYLDGNALTAVAAMVAPIAMAVMSGQWRAWVDSIDWLSDLGEGNPIVQEIVDQRRNSSRMQWTMAIAEILADAGDRLTLLGPCPDE
jgi:hypothetical protein